MKSIICLILVVLTWGESVEAYWQLMRAGRFDEAAAKIETYLNEGRRVSEIEEDEGAALIQKAQVCQEMKVAAKKVDIVDSIKVTKENMISACEQVMGGCKVMKREDGGTEFVATRGNKRFMSIRGESGFDIYRQYGGDEKERLSDVVNTSHNEIFPYEMSDGVTLYFASEGHGSIGGYDLFKTRYDSESFDYREPQNVGMPFNSLGNDYLMMADDMSGLGLWATDWQQAGDTVMVYVYRLEGRDEEKKAKATTNVGIDEEEVMRFVVNDSLIYTTIDNFRSSEARGLYLQMKEMEYDSMLAMMLLESMRMGILTAESDEEKEALIQDIIDNESYVSGLKQRLKEMVKTIRQLEIKQYE